MVQPSGLTLLVCPTAIVSQWMSEFKKHAPGLRVLRYEGMKETFPDSSVDNVQVALTYNVVLTTYDVFASEVKTARKPRIHNTRGKAHLPEHERVSYRRPLFVCLDWLRVVIDEAQMAASTTSAISETASLIPRKFSVAVSGTPIRQTIEDLAGLLQFLRIPEYGTDRRKFSRLLQPVNAEIFTRLISRIGIRTVKSQIQDELVLPDQSRFIVPVRLTRVELFNYKNRYQDAVTQLELAMNTTDFVTKDWSLDAATVVSTPSGETGRVLCISQYIRSMRLFDTRTDTMAAPPPTILLPRSSHGSAAGQSRAESRQDLECSTKPRAGAAGNARQACGRAPRAPA